MALRAAHGQAHPNRPRRTHPIDDVLGVVLLRNCAAFKINHVIAVESRRDQVISCRLRQEIAGQLGNREPIERYVSVERTNCPIPPRPHVAFVVDVIPVGICVSRRI